ncbi:TetR/AcrR family transcriptional regulator [Defluviitalea saccharophila]|uniref:TetR/AcrR family transcriptional regulator n=1 Tax=Defluviitalea saccharophila TaxID=879970 RepID=A0ABZ2Y2T4_9FIRM
MDKYTIRTNKKKQAIIVSALELFREKGYINTSIKEVASRAGVSQVSIYNYFGSKENLVQECAAMLLQNTQEKVMSLLSEKNGFKEKLLKAVSLCSQRPYDLLEEYFSKDALEDKVFIELFQESVSKIRLDILASFIELGKKEGVVDSTISTETILDFLSIALEMQNSCTSQSEHQKKSKELYKLVLYGLIGQ